MDRNTSNVSSSSSKSSVLSPLAAEYVRPSFLGDKKPVFAFPTASKAEEKETVPVQQDDSALFFVDTVGTRTIPDPADEDESDTEELWPRSRVTEPLTKAATQKPDVSCSTAFPELQPKSTSAPVIKQPEADAAQVNVKPYARTVTDDMPIEQIFRPFVPQLSGQAREFVSAATNTGPSGKQDKSRKASKKQAKKEAKERKKERRTNKKNNRRAFKASIAEPKRPRTDDSDVEWGSNGPPSVDEDSESDDDDENTLDITASSSHLKGKIATSGGRRKVSKRDAALEAGRADYAANIGNDPEELEAMLLFAKNMKRGEQLTIDDLDDIADITDSDEETSNDEAYEERVLKKDFIREQGLDKNGKTESYPVYVPAPKEPNTDPEDSVGSAWKTDEDGDSDAQGQPENSDTDMSGRYPEPGVPGSEASSDSDQENADEVMETTIEETILIVSKDDDDEEDEESEDEEEESEDEEDQDDMDEEAELEDAHLAALKSARKKRNGPAPTGADDIDDMLQAQWRKDREKKAIKRQERALARLEAKPSKANSKKAKRAAAKARGFRDDDGDVMGDLDVMGGKVPQFHRINVDLKDFIENSGLGEYALPPMDKRFRVAIHMLAEAYK